MKKIALLFAGQGAQVVGMGRDLAESSPGAKALYSEADQSLGFSLSKISFEGPVEELTKTEVCQPALYVHGLALLAALKEQRPDFTFAATAGLSLGEYTAHAAAGSFAFSTGLKLVQLRGRYMQEACEAVEGGMVSLIGATMEQAEKIAAAADVDVANLNCPGQIVLSGAKANVPRITEAAQANGVRRAIPLNVAGAYHSRLMASAQARLLPQLTEAAIQAPSVPVMANVTGVAVVDATDIRTSLEHQVTGSVRWETCVRSLLEMGCTHFIELGPGAVLGGLMRRIEPQAICISIGSTRN